jgi:hypothetical protein
MNRPKLTLVKGGLTENTTKSKSRSPSSLDHGDDGESEVNLTYGKLISRALFYKKEKETKEIQNIIYSYENRKINRAQLLYCLSKYDYLLSLPCPPFSFICNLKEELLFYLLLENKK